MNRIIELETGADVDQEESFGLTQTLTHKNNVPYFLALQPQTLFPFCRSKVTPLRVQIRPL